MLPAFLRVGIYFSLTPRERQALPAAHRPYVGRASRAADGKP